MVVTYYIEIPPEIKIHLKKITLTEDAMFANKLPFFVNFERDIGLLMVELAMNRTAKQLGDNLMHVVGLFNRAGYEVKTVIIDMESDKIQAMLLQPNINTSAAWEHVANVERSTRVLKERCRGTLSTLPFKQVPNIILIH